MKSMQKHVMTHFVKQWLGLTHLLHMTTYIGEVKNTYKDNTEGSTFSGMC